MFSIFTPGVTIFSPCHHGRRQTLSLGGPTIGQQQMISKIGEYGLQGKLQRGSTGATE